MKTFNITGRCIPELHYMVNLESRLEYAGRLVEKGQYFVINRARQFGKTTFLWALNRYLRWDYIVLSLDFQKMSSSRFQSETVFARAFGREILKVINNKKNPVTGFGEKEVTDLSDDIKGNSEFDLVTLFEHLSELCAGAQKRVVLMIDEMDSASNNQIFLDFLSILRGYYLDRDVTPCFWSVILAGVYDIKNLRQKIRMDEEHRYNSPWNARDDNEENESSLSFDECPRNHRETRSPYDVAVNFSVDMSFSADEIAEMLRDYEDDHHTGMNVGTTAQMICDYTSGYPFLVSDLCRIIDEEVAGSPGFEDGSKAWTKEGLQEAVRVLLLEKNPLFESLVNKLIDDPDLKRMIYKIFFAGEQVTFNPDNRVIDSASMFGFVKNVNGRMCVANRVFEMRIYNLFLSEAESDSKSYQAGSMEKNQFVRDGVLNMDRVMERFMVHWNDLYSFGDERFVEENGRKFFLLYLKPIINGTGNYYIEAQTRDQKRTDIIVDYLGRQYIIEIKIWRGEEYNCRGEKQLAEYLDRYHQKKGYLLSFCFNKKKNTGIKQIKIDDKTITEVVV